MSRDCDFCVVWLTRSLNNTTLKRNIFTLFINIFFLNLKIFIMFETIDSLAFLILARIIHLYRIQFPHNLPTKIFHHILLKMFIFFNNFHIFLLSIISNTTKGLQFITDGLTPNKLTGCGTATSIYLFF